MQPTAKKEIQYSIIEEKGNDKAKEFRVKVDNWEITREDISTVSERIRDEKKLKGQMMVYFFTKKETCPPAYARAEYLYPELKLQVFYIAGSDPTGKSAENDPEKAKLIKTYALMIQEAKKQSYDPGDLTISERNALAAGFKNVSELAAAEKKYMNDGDFRQAQAELEAVRSEAESRKGGKS